MTYFAIRCVAGRELLTKTYIEAAIRNEKRTDIKNVVVPSQTVLDLNGATNNQSDSEIMIRYRSYVFVNIESSDSPYQEMPGNLFHFLNKIPNVIQVMKMNIDPIEVAWLEESLSTLVAIGIPANLKENGINSMLTKAKELIAHKKVLSAFKKFVHSFSRSSRKNKISIQESDDKTLVLAPIELVMEALDSTKLIMSDILKSPITLIKAINGVYYSYAANHSS